MLFIRCAWCHKWIIRPFYARHREKHLKLKPDGQKTDHVTTPPEMRETGESLTEYFKKMRQGYLDIHGAPPPEVEL